MKTDGKRRVSYCRVYRIMPPLSPLSSVVHNAGTHPGPEQRYPVNCAEQVLAIRRPGHESRTAEVLCPVRRVVSVVFVPPTDPVIPKVCIPPGGYAVGMVYACFVKPVRGP